jgi:hypothetical protein
VIYNLLKFYGDLVNNKLNRLPFNSWSINGLIVFKEAVRISKSLLDKLDELNGEVEIDKLILL